MVKSDAPLGLGIAEVCATLGIGRSSVYALLKSGQLRARKIGRRTIFLADEVQRFAETLPMAQPRTPPARAHDRQGR